MPAAAVIPAPIAYIKVVAVKKLVVEFVSRAAGSSLAVFNWRVRGTSCRWASCVRRRRFATCCRVVPVPWDTRFRPAPARARPNIESHRGALHRVSRWAGTFTLNKLECLKQAKKSPEYSVHGIME